MAAILIVDDAPIHRRFLAGLLRDNGHDVSEAKHGSEGLAMARAQCPDLVITDVLMPGMDGYEFVRELRLDPPTSSIPVLFYTPPYAERDARALAEATGRAYVLPKSAEPDEVLKLVGQVLDAQPLTAQPATNGGAADARGHLRLLNTTLRKTNTDLRGENARLRALINIGLDLASRPGSIRFLQQVCEDASDLFGATYATLGIVDLDDRTVKHVVSCGIDAARWVAPGDPLPHFLDPVIGDRQTLRGDNATGAVRLALPALHPEVRAFLVTPIASAAHVHGWICLVGNEGIEFTHDDEELLSALGGQIGRIYALEHEIAERAATEVALRHERDRSQRYLDAAEVMLIALDMDGRITLANRYASEVLGWSTTELVGRYWEAVCVPERLRAGFKQRFDQVVDGDVSVVESRALTKSGDERLVEWHNTLLRDDDGVVTGTLSSGIDYTDRNEAILALRVAADRTRFALEAAGVGIWDMNYRTGVLEWSEILESQYGLKKGTFAGTFDGFIERVHPLDRESLLESMAAASESGGEFSVQNRTLWPDGTIRWLSGTGRIDLGDDGKPVRGVGVSLDVTESRLMEQQYQQAQKMEAIGRLAGGVAHDFNNLLTVILGNCELLLGHFDSRDPRHDDIMEIQKAGVSAAGLTRQLLAFSRKQIIEPTLLDLNQVLSDMRAMIGRLIGEDVKVIMHLPPALGTVMADRGQVEQIIVNLAVNARDAMPKGGTLTIETANVELDEAYTASHLEVAAGKYVALTVSDSGTGMTAETKSHLFEPFFTTKEVGKGTGLGLATVHGIVKRSGGTVNVYSEVGLGTSFRAYFPQVDASQFAATPAPVLIGSDDVPATVLVVEDAEGLRELTRRMLERQGFIVLLAAEAEEALRMFELHPGIDVMLTDVVMPGDSGPELARKLREKIPALRVVYMSGYTEEAIVHHGVLAPGISFLHKPFTSEALGRKIREARVS